MKKFLTPFNIIIVAVIALIIMSHREGFTNDELRKMYVDSKATEFALADGSISGKAYCEKVSKGSKCVAGAGDMGEYLGMFFDCDKVPGAKSGSLIKYKCEVQEKAA